MCFIPWGIIGCLIPWGIIVCLIPGGMIFCTFIFGVWITNSAGANVDVFATFCPQDVYCGGLCWKMFPNLC